MNRKKKNKILLLLILLLGVTVGFAALATTLKINGNASITKNTWSVHWANVGNKSGVTPTTEPDISSEDETHQNNIVSFGVTLDKPGDFYEFQVDAVNDGTIDAMLSVITTNITSGGSPATLPSYIKYTVTYADGVEPVEKHLLAKNTTKRYKIRLEFLKTITNDELNNMPEEGLEYDIDVEIPYIQADPMEKDSVWTLPVGKTADDLEVGDEIYLRADPTQSFNFIRYDGNDVVMLSKYNLKVGNIYSSGAMKIGEYTSSDPGYGLQSSEARGFVSGEPGYGTVSFSTTNYWYDGSELKPEYGDSYPVNVYDAVNYVGEPGELDENERPTNPNYSIAYYVEGYKTKLTNEYHATIKESRLLTYAEATDPSIGCSDSNNNCPTTGFITNTTFLLGTAYNARTIWEISTNGYFQHSNYKSTYDTGVRPVIEVSKSDL